MTNTANRRDTADGRKNTPTEEIANNRKSSESAGSQQQLRQGFIGLGIVHVSHGRVRIQAQSKQDICLLISIAELFTAKDGFSGTSINHAARSLTIRFDESQISTAVVLRILQKLGVADLRTSPQKLPEDPFATWKSGEFWQEQGLEMIPLLLGLAVTGRLGINGFAAIPVYLFTAEITRKVINYLQPQVPAFFTTKTFKNPTKSNHQNTNVQSENQSEHERNGVNTHPSPTSLSVEHRPKLSNQQLLTRKQSESPRCSIDYSVVHAIPGRIRFHVPRVRTDRDYGRNLSKILQADSHVTKVRINRNASSVAIAYENGNLHESYWVKLLILAADGSIKAEESDPTKVTSNTSTSYPKEKTENSSSAVVRGTEEKATTPPSPVYSEPETHNSSQKNSIATISLTQHQMGGNGLKPYPTSKWNDTDSSLNRSISAWWTGMKLPALSYSLEFMANYPLN